MKTIYEVEKRTSTRYIDSDSGYMIARPDMAMYAFAPKKTFDAVTGLYYGTPSDLFHVVELKE